MNLIFKRIVSFFIDYIIILLYGGLLFGITIWIGITDLNPVEGQIVGFLTLTLPVFLYFYLSEKNSKKASVGKSIMKIRVDVETNTKKYSILKRNLLKFIPWEIAHIGVHWSVHYAETNTPTPTWVWFLLIFPQIVVLAYLFSIAYYKGKSSIYDKLANTIVGVH